MEAEPAPSPRHAAHDLTKAAGFVLGPLSVDPPTLQVSAGAQSETLEPRVMRVLVVLGTAEGRVLSRDDLIEQCWDGVIIGDNAINRVISRLRHVLGVLGGGAVRLETITKVGFRLICEETVGNPYSGAAGPAAAIGGSGSGVWRDKWTRRAATLGVAGAGIGSALAFAAWFRPTRHVPDPRAVDLYNRGQEILKGDLAYASVAIKLHRQAVAIDPRYADAWAGIAIGLRYPGKFLSRQLSDPRDVRDAAGRALALNPDNAEARLALIATYPLFRRWLEREAQLRAFLTDHRDSALGNVLLCELLLDVGRLDAALAAARRAVEIEPEQIIGWTSQVRALSYSSAYFDADIAFEETRRHWPQNTRLWLTGSFFLSENKRYAETAAYLRDTTRRPAAIPAALVEPFIRQAEALATGRGLDAVRTFARNGTAASQIENFSDAVRMFVQIGMTDEAFALIEAYYFGGVINGVRVAPPGPLDPRSTAALYSHAILSLRGDPRFGNLFGRIGLEDYWRKSGTQPDFRRGRLAG